MRTHVSLILCIVLLLPSILFAQGRTTFTVLPESAAKEATRLCRGGFPKFDGTWRPTAAAVKSIESHLVGVSHLSAASGARVEHPKQYYRQYIGIVVGKRKLIYVNALCGSPVSRASLKHKRLVDMCDGGNCFWGAVYDVATQQFSDLRINGSG
jgi:hypothetical protein